MSKNWEEMGLSWTRNVVSKQHGDHASDRAEVGISEEPKIVDVDKFRAHFGDAVLLHWLNSANSLTVRSQTIARSNRWTDAETETLRDRVYMAIKGVRMAGAVGTRTVVVHTLPNGTTYDGTDETEYRQAFVAALVDMGAAVEMAQLAAKSAKW